MKFHKGQATDAVLDSSLSTIQKLILVCYIKHANDEGIAWPGGDRLARMTSASIASIKRHRATLMTVGVLQLVKGGEGTVYRVKLCLDSIPTGITVTPVSESDRYQSDTSTGITVTPVPVSERYPNIHKESTQAIHTSPLEPPTGGKPSKVDRAQVLWDRLDAMRLEHSSRRLQPLKLTRNRRRQINGRLRDYTPEAIEAAWMWWWTSKSDSAINLRLEWDIDTFLRPSRHDRYQQAAQEEAARIANPEETPAPSGPLSEADQERLRREWHEAQAERERIEWAESEAKAAELRAMLATPARPAVRLVETPAEDEPCSWSEYQESVR